ncbi:MAG: AAA family ATPase [Sedimentisphaerales bacterium]|nr:AAA family ATPase [Sedimentisphaerales bacterium]
MRITKIDIKNFRGLYGAHEIKLGNPGKNLMIYGENGSGKSSLCQALKVFFESSIKEIDIAQHKNIFASGNPDEDVHVKVTFNDNGTETELAVDKDNKKNPEQYLIEANKIKGFLGYKDLLQTHYLHKDNVNLFNLLICTLFENTPDPITGNVNISFRWVQLNYNIRQRKNTSEYQKCPEILQGLNQSIKKLLEEVEDKANEIIQYFDYNVKIHFIFPGIAIKDAARVKDRGFNNQEITLKVDFFGRPAIDKHHFFLNEGRLTAIAISIYLASILIMPQGAPYKILVLDDILIGLDTSNRLPLLNILKQYFSEYQIIMATYDQQWYGFFKSSFKEEWAYWELYLKKQFQDDYEIPVATNGNYIDISRHYLREGDLKASAVYIRSAFEEILVNHCSKHKFPVPFRKKIEKIPSKDYWDSIKKYDQQKATPKLDQTIITDVEMQRTLVMNPYSHYDLINPKFRSELQTTIDVVERLKGKLQGKYT